MRCREVLKMLNLSITVEIHTDDDGNDFFVWDSSEEIDGTEMVEWLESFLDSVTETPVIYEPERIYLS